MNLPLPSNPHPGESCRNCAKQRGGLCRKTGGPLPFGYWCRAWTRQENGS